MPDHCLNVGVLLPKATPPPPHFASFCSSRIWSYMEVGVLHFLLSISTEHVEHCSCSPPPAAINYLCICTLTSFFRSPVGPLRAGLNMSGVCCSTGYAFAGFWRCGLLWRSLTASVVGLPNGKDVQDGNFGMFHACRAFADQLKESGTYVAMDNFFTSPILLPVIGHRLRSFVVGTSTSNRRRASDAQNVWKLLGLSIRRQGEINSARFGNLCFVQWRDSKAAHFLSTTHMFAAHFTPRSNRGEAPDSR